MRIPPYVYINPVFILPQPTAARQEKIVERNFAVRCSPFAVRAVLDDVGNETRQGYKKNGMVLQ
jgi:hypothetical protein